MDTDGFGGSLKQGLATVVKQLSFQRSSTKEYFPKTHSGENSDVVECSVVAALGYRRLRWISQTVPDDGGQAVFPSTQLDERVQLKTHCGENRNVVACLPVAVATAERMQAIGKPEESSGKRHEKHFAEE